MPRAGRCESCGEYLPPLFILRKGDERHELCRRCYLVLREHPPSVTDRLPIPEGCALRFLFFWWLRLKGRISG